MDTSTTIPSSPQNNPSQHKMTSADDADKSKVRLPRGGYLFTPPENTVDSFSHDDDHHQRHNAQSIDQWRKTLLPPIVHTPPASPEFSSLPALATATGYPAQDSPLFPDRDRTQSDRARSQSQVPLFEKERTPSPARPAAAIRTPDTKTTSAVPAVKSSRPNSFPAILGIVTGQDALRYFYDRVDEANRFPPLKLPKPHQSSSYNLDRESSRQLQSLTRSGGVTKSRPATKPVSKPKPVAATPSPAKSVPPKRRTPKMRTTNDFADSPFLAKETSTKHKRAPPSKKVDGENALWSDLPDFCPPTSTLNNASKPLKVSWHGHALPLTDDPDRHELHEQELSVASTLRLPCAVYLTNKRKIFQARFQALRDGRNFTKTAAQSACKIDVNKASQLWEAFERVGWFDREWFVEYL